MFMTVPVIMSLVTLVVFLAINSSGARGCGAVAGRQAVAAAPAQGCQSAPGPHGRF
jgi:hypothetical protein